MYGKIKFTQSSIWNHLADNIAILTSPLSSTLVSTNFWGKFSSTGFTGSEITLSTAERDCRIGYNRILATMLFRGFYNWSFLQDITIVPLIISWVSSKLSTSSSSWKGPADEMTAAKQKKKHQRYQEARKTYVAAYGLGSRSKSDLPSDILTRSKPRLLFGKHINLFAKWKGTKGTAARASWKQWRCIQICTVATLAILANILRELPQIWHGQKSWWQFEGHFNLTKDAFSYKLKNLFINNRGQISHKCWNEMMDLRFPQDCKVALGQRFIVTLLPLH